MCKGNADTTSHCIQARLFCGRNDVIYFSHISRNYKIIWYRNLPNQGFVSTLALLRERGWTQIPDLGG